MKYMLSYVIVILLPKSESFLLTNELPRGIKKKLKYLNMYYVLSHDARKYILKFESSELEE